MGRLVLARLFLAYCVNLVTSNKAYPVASQREKHQVAQDYHARALQYVMSKSGSFDYTEPLSYFRAAVRLHPDNPFYLNDLGVTEMRTGELQKAKKRFLKALEVEPTNQNALDNLEELRRFMSYQDFNFGLKKAYPQEHVISHPLEVSPMILLTANASDENGRKLLRLPFVSRNALQLWGWDLPIESPNFVPGEAITKLIELYGDSRVDFYPHGMSEEHVSPFFSTMKESIEYMYNPIGVFNRVDASLSGTYIQWNTDMVPAKWNELLEVFSGKSAASSSSRRVLPALFDDVWMEDKTCLPTEELASYYKFLTHWRMLLIGEKESGMFNHKDSLRTSSWQIQLVGSKKWHICGPSEEEYMYSAADVDTFRPDYNRYPKFKNAKCHQFVVQPGDILYYPEDWWHHTTNLNTPSIAITGTLVTKENYVSVRDELRKQCDGKGSIFQPDQILCPALEACYNVWEGMFADSISPMSIEAIDDNEGKDAIALQGPVGDSLSKVIVIEGKSSIKKKKEF